jgi:predicted dehydrogenase
MSADPSAVTRRDFVKTAGGAAAAASLLSLAPDAVHAGGAARRRYAVVGTGVRCIGMWGRDLVEHYGDVVEFVGLCDINPKRVEVAKRKIGVDCPTFTNFDEMCDKTKPELLMVTTVDAFHSHYVVKGLDRGMDVMTEKPMVIDEKQCQAVLDAEKRNKRKIVVTFNYRYAPKHVKMKEILMSGTIGDVVSVDFAWYLNTSHGADYFRRWHAYQAKGGSLWVHKATHHFDLVNWWLGADPVEVTAIHQLRHYGKNGPIRSTNCRPCEHKESCRFYRDITKDKGQMELYVACESEDGYLRDGCVYRPDIDIWDSMSAMVKYSNGVQMAYSLNACMPFEGYRIAFNGTKGRMEVRDYESQPWEQTDPTGITLSINFEKERQKVEVPKGVGGHGGGDNVLRDQIFRKAEVAEHLRLPGSHAGAMSCLTGIAARISGRENNRKVLIPELVKIG